MDRELSAVELVVEAFRARFEQMKEIESALKRRNKELEQMLYSEQKAAHEARMETKQIKDYYELIDDNE